MRREAAVTFRDAIAGSQAQVERWARALASHAGGPLPVAYVPHLSTPHFDFYVVGQPTIGPAGDLFVMCDGQAVLAGSTADFSAVLRREAFVENPDVIAPALFGNLFLRIAIGQRMGVVEEVGDFALGKLRTQTHAMFQPPRTRREGAVLVVSFWTSGPEPFDVRAWEVRVALDGAVTHTAQTVE